jgi:hypothetical protein
LAQSALGKDSFIQWVKDEFLKDKKLPEQPSAGMIKRYRRLERILEIIKKETGKNLEILKDKRVIC